MARKEEDRLPLLALQYHPSDRLDLGRPKQRWKYHKYLQGLVKQVLLDINPKCILLLLLLGYAVAQLVEALRFDFRWCHWNFSLI